MDKKILITGGAGFIGSNTADGLLKKGYSVRVLDLLQERVHPKGKPAYLSKEIEFIKGDVRDKDTLGKALRGVDVVYHFAAYQDYATDFSAFIDVNAVSTALLYEIIVAERLPVRKVVIASSQAAYGEGKFSCQEHGVVFPKSRTIAQLAKGELEMLCPACRKPMSPLLLDEAVVNPFTSYGISKYTQEMIGFNLGRKYNIPTVAMRFSIVQGPRNSFYNAYSGVCRIFTLRLLHKKSPVVYEDGRQLRDYVHVDDVVRANILVLEDSRADFEAFNVAGQKGTTVIEFAKLICQKIAPQIEPEVSGEYRLGDPRHTVSSCEKLKKLGWEPRHDLGRIFDDYLAWISQQPKEDIRDRSEQARDALKEMRVIQKTEKFSSVI